MCEIVEDKVNMAELAKDFKELNDKLAYIKNKYGKRIMLINIEDGYTLGCAVDHNYVEEGSR
ncbi:hypothetical protein [Mucilaginibacter sp. FT3.2]|uniref:hypothetical protein n=1 Tax=Mucilaginibacter sp. FT3.2 TaxID=2723090 RepID=UPI00160E53DA|nr:hypothetical protein [Mucilaginibacter sp. FT3.2]MBB6234190.1 arabinogalactan endo-1,4-beta-galactosidase [Mucilaginibacter sp. FT3.2]